MEKEPNYSKKKTKKIGNYVYSENLEKNKEGIG